MQCHINNKGLGQNIHGFKFRAHAAHIITQTAKLYTVMQVPFRKYVELLFYEKAVKF